MTAADGRRETAGGSGGSLLPREHGAYAQLAFPLLTGLAFARGHPGAVAFALAGVALFLAHEPLAIMAGVRGKRLEAALGAAARRRLAMLVGVAGGAAVAALWLAPGRAWLAAAVPGALALGLLPLFGRRGIKSLGAELLLAAALAAAVLPLALCAPIDPARPAVAALVWLGAFAPSILAVHAVKANRRSRPRPRPDAPGTPPGGPVARPAGSRGDEARWTLVATPVAAALVAAGAGAAALLLPPWARGALAVLPPALAVLVLGLAPPHPRHLKRIGWTMVAVDTVALVLLIVL